MFFFLFNLLNPILIAAAIIPAAFLMYKIYKADRLEPESPRLLLILAGLGILATGAAMILENIGGALVSRLLGQSAFFEIIFYFIVVALSEEGAKYFFLRKRPGSPISSTVSSTVSSTRFSSALALLWPKMSATSCATGWGPPLSGPLLPFPGMPVSESLWALFTA